MPALKCRVPKCNRLRHAGGLCRTCGGYYLHGADAKRRAEIAKYRLAPRDGRGPRGRYKVKAQPKTCLVPGCEAPELSRGLCSACSQYARIGRDEARKALIAQYQLPANASADGGRYRVVGFVAGVRLAGAGSEQYEGGVLLGKELGGNRRLYVSPGGRLNWLRPMEKCHETSDAVSEDDPEALDARSA